MRVSLLSNGCGVARTVPAYEQPDSLSALDYNNDAPQQHAACTLGQHLPGHLGGVAGRGGTGPPLVCCIAKAKFKIWGLRAVEGAALGMLRCLGQSDL
jgi:hypothetical protein